MGGAWRRWSLCGAIVCGALFPSAGCAGIIPWPWSEKYPPKMTERRAEREAYYASRACDPMGSWQVYKHGKLWQPTPRPTDPANLPSHIDHAEHYWPRDAATCGATADSAPPIGTNTIGTSTASGRGGGT